MTYMLEGLENSYIYSEMMELILLKTFNWMTTIYGKDY